ncbi:MAG: ATP-binding cassette domain-containing protein [Acidimicrobiia bacterium]|nr:ATP-binding cassette domain-containing protein [Acidimicrobiia bacterium]
MAVEVEDLVKHFGDVHALDGVSFGVEAGTVLGLLGPNGAGKTTAVRILTSIITPDTGTASVLGIDVAEYPESVRLRIGLAGQYAAVDEVLTGRENLRLVGRLCHLPRADAESRAEELLGRFGLSDAGDRSLKTYSGGMRRRLDLAAALVHRPPVLFLDEPTTGLDPGSRLDLWAIIGELVDEGTTVLLTTQYLEEADRLADQIVVIDHGLVIAEGTATELKGRIGSTHIEVVVAAGAADQARAALSTVGPETAPDAPNAIAIQVADGSKAVLDAVRALDAAAIEVEGLAVREPTLDDVFLELTGHAADDIQTAGD